MAGIKPEMLLWAIVGGIIPTFLWLWFWFSQDKKPVQTGFLSFLYIMGMVCVFLVFPLSHVILLTNLDQKEYVLAFAIIEEVIKVIVTALISFSVYRITKPTDYALYLITLALGFSGLENTLYLIEPSTGPISAFLFASNLRFIGATLLHTICVAIVGIMLGIAYYETAFMKWVHAVFGLGLAIGLHAIFNYFIMINTTRSIIISLSGLWFIGLIVVIIFGRIHRLAHFNEQALAGTL